MRNLFLCLLILLSCAGGLADQTDNNAQSESEYTYSPEVLSIWLRFLSEASTIFAPYDDIDSIKISSFYSLVLTRNKYKRAKSLSDQDRARLEQVEARIRTVLDLYFDNGLNGKYQRVNIERILENDRTLNKLKLKRTADQIWTAIQKHMPQYRKILIQNMLIVLEHTLMTAFKRGPLVGLSYANGISQMWDKELNNSNNSALFFPNSFLNQSVFRSAYKSEHEKLVKFWTLSKPNAVQLFAEKAELAKALATNKDKITEESESLKPELQNIIIESQKKLNEILTLETKGPKGWSELWVRIQSIVVQAATGHPIDPENMSLINIFFERQSFEDLPKSLRDIWVDFYEMLDDIAFEFNQKLSVNSIKPDGVLALAIGHYEKNENAVEQFFPNLAVPRLSAANQSLLITVLVLYNSSPQIRALFPLSERAETFFTLKDLNNSEPQSLKQKVVSMGQKLLSSRLFCSSLF